MRAERLLAGVLATAAALSPTATRRQLAGGLAGGGLALVAPPALAADVLEIPPATTKMGGLLEKYADVARGARKLRRSPARRRRGAGSPSTRRRLAVDADRLAVDADVVTKYGPRPTRAARR